MAQLGLGQESKSFTSGDRCILLWDSESLSASCFVDRGWFRAAKIGGYLGRKNDPPLGHQILWRGYTDFQIVVQGFTLFEGL
jgi:hypothetical protein